MNAKRNILKSGILFLTALALTLGAVAQAKPLKVFILAGQSNMEGHAKIETFDYIGDDRSTAPLLKQPRELMATRLLFHRLKLLGPRRCATAGQTTPRAISTIAPTCRGHRRS